MPRQRPKTEHIHTYIHSGLRANQYRASDPRQNTHIHKYIRVYEQTNAAPETKTEHIHTYIHSGLRANQYRASDPRQNTYIHIYIRVYEQTNAAPVTQDRTHTYIYT